MKTIMLRARYVKRRRLKPLFCWFSSSWGRPDEWRMPPYLLPIKNSQIGQLAQFLRETRDARHCLHCGRKGIRPRQEAASENIHASIIGGADWRGFIVFALNLMHGPIDGSTPDRIVSGQYLLSAQKIPRNIRCCATASRISTVCADFLAWQARFVELVTLRAIPSICLPRARRG